MKVSVKKQKALSHERLVSLLNYDKLTGIFTWLVHRGSHIHPGMTAGTLDNTGYVSIKIDGTPYLAHRLAVFWVTGEWPIEEVDHDDLVRNHNWWNNLRPATPAQNRHHTSIRSSNTSGHTGVSFHKKSGRWRAHIRCGGNRRQLGSYLEKSDAIAAYRTASVEYYGKFAVAA